MSKIVAGLSDVLGFAREAVAGSKITIYTASEFFIGGVRLPPGRYELKRLGDEETRDTDFSVRDF